MSAPLHVVILAAGEGKRMKSSLPKVLQQIAGRPMLAHVIDSARALAPAGIHVVYGHGGEAVRAAFAEQTDLTWAEQAQQLGTGHAVQQAMPNVPHDARVLVLYGDVPLITPATLQRLLAAPGRIAVLVADLEDPTGYGRILRDAEGRVGRIVEHKDADDGAARDPDRQHRHHRRRRRAAAALARAPAQRQRAGRVLPHRRVRAAAATEFDAAEMVARRRPDGNRRRQRSLAAGATGARVPAARRARAVPAGRALRRSGAHRHPRHGQRRHGRGDRRRRGLRRRGEARRRRAHRSVLPAEGRRRSAPAPKCARIATSMASSSKARRRSARSRACARAPCWPTACTSATSSRPRTRRLGVGSKANHLTYLGDAVIGAGVNIGAGTITCNYDGVNKSTTTHRGRRLHRLERVAGRAGDDRQGRDDRRRLGDHQERAGGHS